MRYLRFVLVLCLFACSYAYVHRAPVVHALDLYDYIQLSITPIPCSGDNTVTCPLVYAPEKNPNYSFQKFYTESDPSGGSSYNTFKQGLILRTEDEFCAARYEPPPTPEPDAKYFTQNPRTLHFWAEDQEVTALGKAVDRSRQFVYWTIMSQAVDQSLSLKQIWSMNRNIALGFMIVITATLGLAIALSLRLRSGYKFSAQGALAKVALSILYIALSASIVFSLIALSEVLMKFFIETLGGNRVFNTYFGATSSEANYVGFYGCRDLNIRVQEAADTQMFVLKLSIITNYMMGIMFILRKILLWFLLLVSPFLPLLLAFPLIRNTGKIWIGVFFQWLFYGPLFALFFGATAKLFQDGIPYVFDFSRIEKSLGYIFPTAIRITYGGPAQQLSGLNNANYIDTFAEYVISLLLWWAATWFPWWLLRIFRDDCCDGIYAIKNALYGLLDKPAKPHGPGPQPPARPPTFDVPPPTPEPMQKRPEETNRSQAKDVGAVVDKIIRLENPTMVRQAKTTDLVHTLSLRATKLTDVARLETTSALAQTVRQNLALLANPLTAQTATERQKYLTIRTELFTRASTRNDTMAQYILSTTATSSRAYIEKRNEMASSLQTMVQKVHTQQPASLAQLTSQSWVSTGDYSTHVSSSLVQNIMQRTEQIQHLAQQTNISADTITQILRAYSQTKPASGTHIVDTIATTTQIAKEKVATVMQATASLIQKEQVIQLTTKVLSNIMHNEHAMQSVASATQTTKETARQILASYMQHVDSSFTRVVDRIAETTGVSKEKIASVLHQTKIIVAKAQSMRQLVQKTHIDQSKMSELLNQVTAVSSTSAQTISQNTAQAVSAIQQLLKHSAVATYTKELFRRFEKDDQLITMVQQETGLSKKQVIETISTLAEAPSIFDQTMIVHLRDNAGVSLDKILHVVRETLKHGQTAQEVARPETAQEQEIMRDIERQLDTATNPESAIDETIALDDAHAIEEYNEIRTLWLEQYRTGEVPVSEQIHTRLEWVEQDSIVMADILTRLVSEDEKERQEALDDIGFILPIFLINNLSGTQLVTYLKAKLSAAKEIRIELTSKENEEEFEEVHRKTGPTEENTKHMELDASGDAQTISSESHRE